MESYIENKKNLYKSIYEFLEQSDDHCDEGFSNEYFQKLIDVIKIQQIERDRKEMCQFIEIIKSIGEHHHRDQHFNERLNQILEYYKDQIKKTFSNIEIFHIFENNKRIVHFLLKKSIITISDEIFHEMIRKVEKNGNIYWYFFIPELENFIGEEKMRFVKNELLKENPALFTNFEEKCQEGENESYICSLIRQDLVKEFVTYMNRYNISLSSEISPSIFETNPLLIDNKKTTLLEYSAFFGSIQIFRYLITNKAELNSSLWLYAIHSENAEMIHLLESYEIPLPKDDDVGEKAGDSCTNYKQCLIESIKCHHNDIAYYFENILLSQTEKDIRQNEDIISSYIKYHNYSYFQNEAIIEHGFFYLHLYGYDKLVDLFLKKKEKLIEKKIMQYNNIQAAAENNEVEVIYHLLLKEQEISDELFSGINIKQIVIPSSITSIGDNAFRECSTLTQISIPSSVTKIGKNAFSGCSSLTQISIPSSVTSIGIFAFCFCFSLKQISIPSSVTEIGDGTFYECESLANVTIPSSVTSIGYLAFKVCESLAQITIPSSVSTISSLAFMECKSLTQITIPSSVNLIEEGSFKYCTSLARVIIPSSITLIKDSTFKGCSSLIQIIIPSSVTYIGNSAFEECSSLTQITIPSSITYIGNSAFKECSSLKQITIPSSVTSIKKYIFYKCSSLTQITIPSSITSIEDGAFYECSSLKQIEIPSSVTSIGNSPFANCTSLTQITIPSSVTSIGSGVFAECSSLKQIEIPSSLTSIGNGTFGSCSSLTQIIIPSSVTSIGYNVFRRCSSLIEITIPSSVTSIGESAFSTCSLLKQITIPYSVIEIRDYAFEECISLTQITIPSSVTSIGKKIFRGCSSLTKILIPSYIFYRNDLGIMSTVKIITY